MKFKFFGTEIYISFLFSAVIAFMILIDRTGLIIPTLLAVSVHEIGHLIAMWAAECQPKAIRLIPASVQIIRGFSCKRGREIAISLAGPAANLAFFAMFLFVFSETESEWALRFCALNLVLAIYNLLPVNGLDGGAVLCRILERRFEPQKAEGIVRITAFILGLAAMFIGVFLTAMDNFNISIYIVALYLIISSFIKS